ncbi:MAG TPA: HEAT repeat domain-containing protein [Chloroflexia bacterium]|nr:HEAT repeat domain-containing protein [Chloroflexia bacterium]
MESSEAAKIAEQLNHPMWDDRLRAVENLSKLDDPAVLDYLLLALEDYHSDVLRTIIEKLRKFKDERAFNGLLKVA